MTICMILLPCLMTGLKSGKASRHPGYPALKELPSPQKKHGLDLSPEDSGQSTALKDAQLVVKK